MNEFREIYISSIIFNPENESYMMVCLSNNTLYKTKMPHKNEAQIMDYDLNFEPVSLNFHYKQINDMDIATRKPLIATCGSDKCIRIWCSFYSGTTNKRPYSATSTSPRKPIASPYILQGCFWWLASKISSK